MSTRLAELLDAARALPITAVGASPVVATLKQLRGEEAAAFVRAHAAHGRVVDTHGPSAHVAAFAVTNALLPHAQLDGAFLLEHMRWPSEDAWNAAMLALAKRGELTPAQTVSALRSPGFAAEAAALLPFGRDAWAVELRAAVASWKPNRRAGWAAFVDLVRDTDLPLRPSEKWLAQKRPRDVAKKLAPSLPDVVRCLHQVSVPEDLAIDDASATRMDAASAANARLLHGLVLFVRALQPDGADRVLEHVAHVASTYIEGLGTYLPKLAYRAVGRLPDPGSSTTT
jgi:hypothetical protein